MRGVFYSALAAAMTIAPANAQAPQPAGTGITTATYNLINCFVAQNAGDVRWFQAVFTHSAGLSPSLEKGAELNALDGVRNQCRDQGADVPMAVGMSIDLVKFHFNSENRRRPTYDLADCLVKSAPKEANVYLEDLDKARVSGGIPSFGGVDFMFKAHAACAAEMKKLNNKIDANDLYSRLNWVLRAHPILSQQQTPTKTAGQ